MREGSGGEETVDHASSLPDGVCEWLDDEIGRDASTENDGGNSEDDDTASPFIAHRMDTLHNEVEEPALKRARHWIRGRGTISPHAGHQAHLSALAYMSDSYFIGTVARVHNLWRFGRPKMAPSTTVRGGAASDSSSSTTPSPKPSPPSSPASTSSSPSAPDNRPTLAQLEARENAHAKHGKTIGMMVSLDHTIFFHRPQAIRADEWLFAEMESPWAGDGRGLVFQKIWNRRGELVATCVQEGLVRLVQGGEKVKL
jgi:acyl-CoA thioesterase